MSRLRKRRAVSTITALLSALMLLSGDGGRASAGSGDADSLITQGVQLRRQNRDQEALPLFKKAWESDPNGRASGQLGLCEQALGLWVDAETHLKAALARSSEPWIRKNGAMLREALAHVQGRLASLDLWGTPAGARVLVDGQAVGTLPLSSPIRLVDGSRVVTVEAKGFISQSRTLEIKPSSALREHIALAPVALGASPPVADSPAARPVAPVAAAAAGPQVDLRPSNPDATVAAGEPPSAVDQPFYKRWWFWTAVGVVVVAGTIVTVRELSSSSGCQAAPGGTCVEF